MSSGAPPAISDDIWDSLIPLDGPDAPDSEPVPADLVTGYSKIPAALKQALDSRQAASHQPYQPYGHYPQPTYQAQQPQAYQPYQYTQPASASTSTSMARAAIANSQAANAGSLDTSDVATLTDALGSAGVDLRAEEESLQRLHEQPQPFRPFEDRARKQPARPNFDVSFLGATMRTIAAHHKVSNGIPEDCINYLALALRARLQDLVTAMIDAARHRTSAQFDHPTSLYEDGTAAWGILVRADVAKQLAALELVEREEELKLRRVRERREQAITAALAAVLAGEDRPLEIPPDDEDDDMDGGARKRRKKKGAASAGVSEEEVGRKMTNAAASRAAGITGKYAWMTTGHIARHKPAVVGATAPSREGSGWVRPYRATKREPTPPPLPPDADQRMPITIRDAMFAVEKERGHGGGRGAARGWS